LPQIVVVGTQVQPKYWSVLLLIIFTFIFVTKYCFLCDNILMF
jgi:hypothetical protein